MIICMVIASVLTVLFIILFISANDSIAHAFVVCNREIQMENIKTFRLELNLLAENMKRTNDLNNKKKNKTG